MKKFFGLLFITSLLLCFVGCESKDNTNADTQTTMPTTLKTNNTTQANKPTEKEQTETTFESTTDPQYMQLYWEIVTDYKKLIDFRLSEQFNNSWYENIKNVDFSETFKKTTSDLNELDYRWSNMIVELPAFDIAKSSDDFGYILYDINDDNIPELFWVRNDYSIVAIFTYKNDSVVLLDAFWSRYNCFVSKDGKIYCYGSNGAADNELDVYSLTASAELKKTYGLSSESNHDFETGQFTVNFYEYSDNEKKEISQEVYSELLKLYPHNQSNFWLSFPIKSLNNPLK